ncbi:MAG: hypothetical protein VKJ64_01665, partial [Leptolyngbyaceae bacterium]|nr:hypothetical protein [Leptolyngbyaceae bacterium]
MPKLSYGPAAKARVAALFAALIDYGNDAVEADEAQLERLRSHITSHWQGDRTLIVRTKLRYLQLLTQLACDQPPLTAAQIKDCLKYLEQFLGILQDNRTSRRGSDVWHFTLTLWRSRWDRGENLHQFDQQWQARRTAQPSANIPHALASAPKQVKSLAANAGRGDGTDPRATPADQGTPDQLTFWRDLIQRDLINRRHTNLTTNPLTAQTGQKLTVDQIYVPLGLVEEPYSSAP